MAECQRCGSKSQLFLCPTCTAKVQRQLNEMPWWLNRLTEAACGQTKMSDNGGRRSTPRTGIKGEALLAECIESFPNEREEDLERARRQRAQTALAHALAAGGVNPRASELLATIVDSLQYWVKDLCDSRGIQYEPLRFRGSKFIGPLQLGEVRKSRPKSAGADYALWMAEYISAIASSEYADDIVGDIEGHMADIEKAVNRPIPTRYLKCQTWMEDQRQVCGMDLRAKADDIEVFCRKCRATHNVNRLQLLMREALEREMLTVKQILDYNRTLPEEFRVNERRLRRWRQNNKLQPCGFREGGEPMYRWADVQRLKTGDTSELLATA